MPHAVARGAEWARAAGYAKYMPTMIMDSYPAVVAWLDRSNRSKMVDAARAGRIHRRLGTGHVRVGWRTAQAGSSPRPRT